MAQPSLLFPRQMGKQCMPLAEHSKVAQGASPLHQGTSATFKQNALNGFTCFWKHMHLLSLAQIFWPFYQLIVCWFLGALSNKMNWCCLAELYPWKCSDGSINYIGQSSNVSLCWDTELRFGLWKLVSGWAQSTDASSQICRGKLAGIKYFEAWAHIWALYRGKKLKISMVQL